MTTILEGAGLLLALLGGAAAESQNVMVPIVMIEGGIMLMFIGYRNEWRWN